MTGSGNKAATKRQHEKMPYLCGFPDFCCPVASVALVKKRKVIIRDIGVKQGKNRAIRAFQKGKG